MDVMSAENVVRAGVIGVGAMGRHHARVYTELKQMELVAVADPDEEAAQEIARRYKIAWYADYNEMLMHERLDVVSVAVPTRLHRQVASDVIDAGVHLLVEKPLASSVEEGREIIHHARKRGVKLGVGHVERFNPAILELKRRLAQGALGKVFLIHARRLGPFPTRIQDVGVILDLATHDLDVMRFLISCDVEKVYAETARCIHTDHEDILSGLLRFTDGTIGVLDVNWLTPTKVRELSVTGEKGTFMVNYLVQDLYFYENSIADSTWESLGILKGVGEGNMIRLQVEKREPLRLEIEDFIGAVLKGGEPLVNGEDALSTLALAEKLAESGRCGRSITLQGSADEILH